MEELNLKDLLIYYIKKFPVIILTIILAILLCFGYIEFIQVPKYKGTTTIILVENSDNRVSSLITQTEIMANEELVTTYSEIIKSKRVLNKVIKDLNLKISLEDLRDIIEVLSIDDTAIIEIEVKNKSNKKAATIANKVAEVFIEQITQIYNLENVSIIDKADIESEPYNVKVPLQLGISGGIGFVFSIFLLTIMFYFNNSIKSKQEIEQKLNISVIGEIPTIDKITAKKIKENLSSIDTFEKTINNESEIVVDQSKKKSQKVKKETLTTPKSDKKDVKSSSQEKDKSKKDIVAKSAKSKKEKDSDKE